MTNRINLDKNQYSVTVNKDEVARRYKAQEFGETIEASGSSIFKYELVPYLAEWMEEREASYKLLRGYDAKNDVLGMDIVIDDVAVAIEFKLTWQ